MCAAFVQHLDHFDAQDVKGKLPTFDFLKESPHVFPFCIPNVPGQQDYTLAQDTPLSLMQMIKSSS